MQLTLPNVILVGTQKSGTTALYNWLSQHPDVFGEPAMKDFPFFCSDGYLDKGLEWFARRFSGWNGEKVILHGYVHYLFYAEETGDLFTEMLPDVKLIAVLRNPVDRAYSSFLQAKKTGRERLSSFEEAIEYELAGKLEGFDELTNRGYLAHGRYSQQLELLLARVPAERVKILLFDDLNERPAEVCRELFDFMEVDSSFAPELVRKNDFGVPRTRIMSMLNAPNPFSWLARHLVPLNLRIRLRHGLISLNTRKQPKPVMSPDLMRQMYGLYEEEIDKLEKLLGRSLDCWRAQAHKSD